MSKGHKKLLRSSRHKKSGKYQRQRVRTEANKARRKAKHQATLNKGSGSFFDIISPSQVNKGK